MERRGKERREEERRGEAAAAAVVLESAPQPLAAPSLHLLSGSSGDTRLGQAPGTRESGPG